MKCRYKGASLADTIGLWNCRSRSDLLPAFPRNLSQLIFQVFKPLVDPTITGLLKSHFHKRFDICCLILHGAFPSVRACTWRLEAPLRSDLTAT